MKFMKKLQIEQPGFYHAVRTDDDNTVRSIFWTDSNARLDYELYGDFISFDTTFSTKTPHSVHTNIICPLLQ